MPAKRGRMHKETHSTSGSLDSPGAGSLPSSAFPAASVSNHGCQANPNMEKRFGPGGGRAGACWFQASMHEISHADTVVVQGLGYEHASCVSRR
eukprot:1149216-Pelagomonas_calceolata.AAC.6